MTRVARACPAWPAPSSEGLLLSEPLAAKGSQGFGKKCNFRLGSKVLPQRDTTATSPFNSFGTSKGKGTTGGQHGPPNPTEGVRTCGSPFLTPGHPVTRPVGYQSAVSRGARRGRGTGPRGARGRGTGEGPAPTFDRTHLSRVYSRTYGCGKGPQAFGDSDIPSRDLCASPPVRG